MKQLISAVQSQDQDGTLQLTLAFDQEATDASRVEMLVHSLLAARASMEPQFPVRLPVAFEVTAEATVHYPAWQWSMTSDSMLALNLLHPGLGWIHFRMPDAAALHKELGNALEVLRSLQAEQQGPAA